MKKRSVIIVMIVMVSFFSIFCSKEENLLKVEITNAPDNIDEEWTEKTTRSLFDVITDVRLKEAIEKNVVLSDGTEIESYEWVDEEKKCLRMRVQYTEEPADNYRHKEDYFFFINEDIVQTLYVDYQDKDYSNIDKDRYIWNACDFNAHFEDVTFDGQDDLIIFLGYSGVHGTCIYGAYIYKNGFYDYESSFEKIPNYEIDNENQCINGYNVDSASANTLFKYKYSNDKFELINSAAYEYKGQ